MSDEERFVSIVNWLSQFKPVLFLENNVEVYKWTKRDETYVVYSIEDLMELYFKNNKQ